MGVKNQWSQRSLLTTLLLSTAVSVGFLLARIVATGELTYGFLVWNLLLGWIPLLLSGWLVARLRTSRWLTFGNVLLSLLWLFFLPNAFYIASDLIHPAETGHISVLFDVVMFLSFTF